MRTPRHLPVLLALAASPAVGCGGGDSSPLECDPTEEECVFSADVSTVEIGAGVEDEDTCQSWTLDNPTELWVNRISQVNGGAYHHANWFFVPDDEFDLPDGTWSCSEQDFSELNAALLGGYLFALSTQSGAEDQALPEGSAIRIPPYSRIIGSSHLLNATPTAVTTTMNLSIHTVPPARVLAKMAPARIQYHDLTIDPMGRSSFTTECLFDEAHESNLGAPLQYELHYTLAHYHGLGAYAQLELAGGPRDGEVIMRHDGYGENFGQAMDPPLELADTGARGLRFTCGYDNPRDAEVGWGIGDQEMCVIALQARTGFAFEGDVRAGQGALVEETPDGERRYAGPCGLLGFAWDFEKAGGPPR
jgi:hypothetical protein